MVFGLIWSVMAGIFIITGAALHAVGDRLPATCDPQKTERSTRVAPEISAGFWLPPIRCSVSAA